MYFRFLFCFFFSSRRRHTRCALVTGVQTCALPIYAGVSSFEGRERCNDFSIGIELEGCDDRPFTQKQYRRLITVTHLLLQALPRLLPARINGHCDHAPGAQPDPGPVFVLSPYRPAPPAPSPPHPKIGRSARR